MCFGGVWLITMKLRFSDLWTALEEREEWIACWKKKEERKGTALI